MALFTAIKADHKQKALISSPFSLSKSVSRGDHELKRLSCSMNYIIKGSISNRGVKL